MSARKASPAGDASPAAERRSTRKARATTPGRAAPGPVRLFHPCRACLDKAKRGCPACRQSGMVWRILTKEELHRSVLDGAMHPDDVVAFVAWRGSST